MKIFVQNRQRAIRLNVPWLRTFAETALPLCAEVSADGGFALKALEEVEVAIVSDQAIAKVHQQFMEIAGPTDVITFGHGEIVISAETAAEYGREYGLSTELEIALYTVHGLLHLNGFEDSTKRQAAKMEKIQERIWRSCLSQIPKP